MREKHYPALDGLRGLAALMIVAHHSALSYVLSNTFDKAYLRLTSTMWVGVDLFFVLSGFLITNILLDTRVSPNYFKAFYGRRVVKIFPLYYGYLAILFLLLPALGVKLPADLVNAQFWQWTYTSNIYTAFHYWQNVFINHFWTLAIEEQFYLFWPIIVFFVGRRYLKTLVIALFLALPILRFGFLTADFSSIFIYTFTLCHIDGLLLGGLISMALHEGIISKVSTFLGKSKIKALDWLIGGILLTLFVVYFLFLRNDQLLFNFETWSHLGQCVGITLVSLPLAYFVLRAIAPDKSFFQKILSFKYLQLIGKYSYALYVLHAPICYWAGSHFPVPSLVQNLPPTWSFVHSLYLILIQFVLSIAAAVISWNILEKHFLKLKKYFPYQL